MPLPLDSSLPMHGPFEVALTVSDLRVMSSGREAVRVVADSHGVEQATLRVRLDAQTLALWRRFRL